MPKIRELQKKAISGKGVSYGEAKWLLGRNDDETLEVIAAANEIRKHFKGKKVKLCSIVNAKSGRCPEDCGYCAQSSYHKAKIDIYPLMSADEMHEKAKKAKEEGAAYSSIVTSGKGINSQKEMDEICLALKKIGSIDINRCASLGILNKDQLKKLKAAGLKKFHHNLETSKSYFGKICTTHKYEDRIATIKAAKEAGLSVCSGGIFGLGESPEQRVELAFMIKELDPDSIPINFFNPIKGTRLEKNRLLEPLEALRIIAMFRFVMPEKDIVICGGREVTLRSLQPLMFSAGANMTMLGNYLTTAGNKPEDDLKMINDLGLKVSR
jgi:biotin synthase